MLVIGCRQNSGSTNEISHEDCHVSKLTARGTIICYQLSYLSESFGWNDGDDYTQKRYRESLNCLDVSH